MITKVDALDYEVRSSRFQWIRRFGIIRYLAGRYYGFFARRKYNRYAANQPPTLLPLATPKTAGKIVAHLIRCKLVREGDKRRAEWLVGSYFK